MKAILKLLWHLIRHPSDAWRLWRARREVLNLVRVVRELVSSTQMTDAQIKSRNVVESATLAIKRTDGKWCHDSPSQTGNKP